MIFISAFKPTPGPTYRRSRHRRAVEVRRVARAVVARRVAVGVADAERTHADPVPLVVRVVGRDRAEDAVDAGIATLQEVQHYNRFRRRRELNDIEVGIGLNTGPMMVGMVGYDRRIQGDAFSDAVNLTSRVESLTKNYGVSFLITDDTRTSLSKPEDYDIRFVDRVRVKGKRQSLDLFEVFNANEQSQRDLKRETAELYQSAVDAYHNGEYELAQSCLFSVLQQNPADKVAWNRLLKATQALDEGTTDGWETTVMTEK